MPRRDSGTSVLVLALPAVIAVGLLPVGAVSLPSGKERAPSPPAFELSTGGTRRTSEVPSRGAGLELRETVRSCSANRSHGGDFVLTAAAGANATSGCPLCLCNLFADGFESGTTAAWSSVAGAARGTTAAEKERTRR